MSPASRSSSSSASTSRMTAAKGSCLFEGYGFGIVHCYSETGESHPQQAYQGYEVEKARYEAARKRVIEDTQALRQREEGSLKDSDLEIVDAHLAMLDDLDLADLVDGALQGGDTAEGAIQSACDSLSSMLEATGDEYIAARSADVREITSQIVGVLSGRETLTLKEPTILLADGLGVSTLLSLDRKLLEGIVLYNTGKTSHTAIVIRSLGLPCFIGEGTPDRSLEGKRAVLDAASGELLTDLSPEEEDSFRGKDRALKDERRRLEGYRGVQVKTLDGHPMEVCANIASPDDCTDDLVSAADGVGLFRSEFIYLDRSDYPDEETQFQAYSKVVKAMGSKRTIIRTFDIGTDKKTDYFGLPDEDNPALGYRSIRICRDRKELFTTQLRALCRASALGNLAIMIPMIMDESELDYALDCVHEAQSDLKAKGVPYNPDMKVGIMVETPAAAVISDRLARKAAFFSIGTNDLTQYTLAIDRTNQNVARFSDPHHPAVLRLMKLTAENAHRAGIPVGICGELGHDAYLLPFFCAIGIDELSMVSTYILQTKDKISQIDASKVDLSEYIG